MACSIAWDHESKAPEGIAGDRRSDRRYPILLNLRWKLIHRKRVLDTGVGSTRDLSSGGILIESNRPLPKGFDVELAISWPVLLHNVAPMQLVVQGRIVRSERNGFAIRMIQHEFRTAGIPASRTNKPFLATINSTASLQ
jgi:hypothetical protein